MIPEETLAQADAELANADKARATGFEGRARAGARRAAGIVARSFLSNRGVPMGSASAYDVLQTLHDWPETTHEIQQVIEHLLMRVNEDHQLPLPVDLIAETRWLIQTLTKD